MLICIRQWATGPWRGPLTVLGDAEGVLAGITALNARSPKINAVAREVALLLAPSGRHLRGVHVWSEGNSLADALSRLSSGEVVPPRLARVPRASVAARDCSRWRPVEGSG